MLIKSRNTGQPDHRVLGQHATGHASVPVSVSQPEADAVSRMFYTEFSSEKGKAHGANFQDLQPRRRRLTGRVFAVFLGSDSSSRRQGMSVRRLSFTPPQHFPSGFSVQCKHGYDRHKQATKGHMAICASRPFTCEMFEGVSMRGTRGESIHAHQMWGVPGPSADADLRQAARAVSRRSRISGLNARSGNPAGGRSGASDDDGSGAGTRSENISPRRGRRQLNTIVRLPKRGPAPARVAGNHAKVRFRVGKTTGAMAPTCSVTLEHRTSGGGRRRALYQAQSASVDDTVATGVCFRPDKASSNASVRSH